MAEIENNPNRLFRHDERRHLNWIIQQKLIFDRQQFNNYYGIVIYYVNLDWKRQFCFSIFLIYSSHRRNARGVPVPPLLGLRYHTPLFRTRVKNLQSPEAFSAETLPRTTPGELTISSHTQGRYVLPSELVSPLFRSKLRPCSCSVYDCGNPAYRLTKAHQRLWYHHRMWILFSVLESQTVCSSFSRQCLTEIHCCLYMRNTNCTYCPLAADCK